MNPHHAQKTSARVFSFILLSCLVLGSGLAAQEKGSITGRVVDAKTKKAMIGANIVVMNTNLGAAANLDGDFTINNVPVGLYQVKFTFIGYEPLVKTDVVVKSAKPTYLNAELREDVVQQEAITVTAGYFVESAKVQPSTIALTQEEIRRFPGGFEDVVRTVSTLPGVSINMTAGRNDLLVRGGGPSENLYIINNIEVPNINHFGTPGNTGGSLSFVNLDFVEDVTFSTGGFSARYGDKMSSVIALKMVSDRPERAEAKFTVSATQYGFDFDVPLNKKGNFIFSARKSYLDLIFKAAGLPFVPIYTDFNVLLNYDLSPKDQLFLIGFSAINNVDRNLSTEENRVFNAGILDNTQYKGITGLNYRRLFGRGYMDATFSVNLTRYRLSQIDENQETYFTNDADEWEYGLKLQGFLSLAKTLDLRAGLSTRWIRNINTSTFADTIYDRSGNRIPSAQLGLDPLTEIKDNVYKHSGFVEVEWIPSRFFQCNAGARLDYYDYIRQSFYPAPRLSMKFRPLAKHTVRVSGGLYYQSPAYTWVANPANVQLKALQNRMGVLGYDLQIRDDLRFSLEGYYKNYRDLPTGTIPGVNDYIVMSNTGSLYGGREDDFQSFGYFDLLSLGRGEAWGAELLLQKKLSRIPLFGLASLSYNKGQFQAANGIWYPGQYDQRFIFNLSGGYILGDSWEFSAKFRYFTGIPYTPVYRPSENPLHPGTLQNLPEEYLSQRLRPGHHLDIRVDKFFNFRGVTLIVYVDIQNVYNYKIQMRPVYNFWTDQVTDTGDIGILPSLGISLEI